MKSNVYITIMDKIEKIKTDFVSNKFNLIYNKETDSLINSYRGIKLDRDQYELFANSFQKEITDVLNIINNNEAITKSIKQADLNNLKRFLKTIKKVQESTNEQIKTTIIKKDYTDINNLLNEFNEETPFHFGFETKGRILTDFNDPFVYTSSEIIDFVMENQEVIRNIIEQL